MIYKVQVTLAKASKPLFKMGVKETIDKPFWIKVEADDPDEACHAAQEKIYNTAKRKWKTTSHADAADILKEHMRIISVKVYENY